MYNTKQVKTYLGVKQNLLCVPAHGQFCKHKVCVLTQSQVLTESIHCRCEVVCNSQAHNPSLQETNCLQEKLPCYLMVTCYSCLL